MKVLFVQNTLLHYRKAFYNALAQKCKVVVVHSGKPTVTEGDDYEEVILTYSKLGPFYIQRGLIKAIKRQSPNFVIGMFDIRWLNTFRLLSTQKYYKFLWWGLDTGNNNNATKIKVLIARLGYPIIFYNEFNRDKMARLNLGSSPLFVANNTFDVGNRTKSYENPIKDKILFVGSFDYRKRNDILVKVFSQMLPHIPDHIMLNFVGDGEEKENIESLVSKLGISDRIKFSGRVDDAEILSTYYQEAIFAVSYGQAGLSVLQSLGFGVPYITSTNAISGGEVSNIQHGTNGYFCDDLNSFKSYMLSLITDVEHARRMGINAYEYYSVNCTVDNMVNGFMKALN